MIYENYAIFTPGPVKMHKEILELGAKQTPYFRNQAFSDVVLECEENLLEMLNAPKGSRVVFLTASGTAAMEASVMNLMDSDDNALMVNGGGFGARFVDIANRHNIPNFDFKVENTNLNDIENIAPNGNFSWFVVNAHETTIGLLYDLEAISKYTKKNNMLLMVDAISMFVTDPIDMKRLGIDCVIISSQKGLALPPGLSMVVLSPRALERLKDVDNLYFDFSSYLINGQRGQTPFTPAVTIILQLQKRLQMIKENGGIINTIELAQNIANYFRENIKNLPLKFYTPYMPNAMTALIPTDGKSAKQIVKDLEDNYKLVVCPNGGDQADTIFRVSHMGDMSKEYVDILINALRDYYKD